jgi:hypothetical protein
MLTGNGPPPGGRPRRPPREAQPISTDDEYVRREPPRRDTRDDRGEDDYERPPRRDDDRDRPYRPRGRYDVRRGRTDEDREHLRLLSIFHYILGALFGLFGCIPIIHLSLGLAIVSGATSGPGGAGPPPAVGWIFIAVGGGIMLMLWTLAGCLLFAGRCLAVQKAYTFCFVVACLSCLQMPLGTLLGVFTIIVLVRPSVKARFEAVREGADADTVRDY